MKIRKDFVTNSSSSSFICEVCGHIESGWDISFEEAGMVECEYGHIFCEEEVIKTENDEKIKIEAYKRDLKDRIETQSKYDDEYWKKRVERYKNLLTRIDEEIEEYEILSEELEDEIMDVLDWYNTVPVENCPICTMQHIIPEDMLKYLLNKEGISVKELKEEIRNKYSNDYQSFIGFLRK